MSFTIITDSTANIETRTAKEHEIVVIPLSYNIDGKEYVCSDTDSYDDISYYNSIKSGVTVTTSQVNPQTYIDCMEPILRAGQDIIFVGLSSGISGSFNSAMIAREQLLETYPERKIRLIDSLGASLGEGLLVMRAVKCRSNGMSVDEAADYLDSLRHRIYQVFIVDDLMHLKRTGRLSNIGAVVGSVLGIKPLLKGNENGRIVAFEKIRGRMQAIKAMAEKYYALADDTVRELVGISHCGCPEDAAALSELIRKKHPSKEIMIVKHEPVTGSHIGPGSLALYFEGGDNVRYM